MWHARQWDSGGKQMQPCTQESGSNVVLWRLIFLLAFSPQNTAETGFNLVCVIFLLVLGRGRVLTRKPLGRLFTAA